jgi:hypothetical protein
VLQRWSELQVAADKCIFDLYYVQINGVTVAANSQYFCEQSIVTDDGKSVLLMFTDDGKSVLLMCTIDCH